MSDLELRRKTWEALGLSVRTIEAEQVQCLLFTENGRLKLCPPIETDDGVALRELVKFCDAKNYQWQLITCEPHESFDKRHIVAWLHDSNDLDVETEGATIAECCCRVIIAASGKEKP